MTAPLGSYQIFKALHSLVDIREYSFRFFAFLHTKKFFEVFFFEKNIFLKFQRFYKLI
jgi:hypothetical protein